MMQIVLLAAIILKSSAGSSSLNASCARPFIVVPSSGLASAIETPLLQIVNNLPHTYMTKDQEIFKALSFKVPYREKTVEDTRAMIARRLHNDHSPASRRITRRQEVGGSKKTRSKFGSRIKSTSTSAATIPNASNTLNKFRFFFNESDEACGLFLSDYSALMNINWFDPRVKVVLVYQHASAGTPIEIQKISLEKFQQMMVETFRRSSETRAAGVKPQTVPLLKVDHCTLFCNEFSSGASDIFQFLFDGATLERNVLSQEFCKFDSIHDPTHADMALNGIKVKNDSNARVQEKKAEFECLPSYKAGFCPTDRSSSPRESLDHTRNTSSRPWATNNAADILSTTKSFIPSDTRWLMGQKYLNFTYDYKPSVDVVMSIRSINNETLFARPFYMTWLHYWPIHIGKLILFSEPNLSGTANLVNCLQQLPCAPVDLSISPITYMEDDTFSKSGSALRLGGKKKWTRWYSFMMQLWKFEADQSSSADIIAFTDDDSCMNDMILPSEIVSSNGKLVARGCEYYKPDRMRDKRFVPLGIPAYPHLSFMTDFPVYIWREMFVDFRRSIIRHIFPDSECSGSEKNELKLFWKAMSTAYKRDTELYLEEYSNLLLFAFHSPKWSDRYEWQIIREGPDNTKLPILSHATHHEPCISPPPSFELRQRNDSFVSWAAKRLRYPPGSMYPQFDVHTESRLSHIPGFNEYISSSKINQEWDWYSIERQRALAFYIEGRNVTATDECGNSIVDSWQKCFNDNSEIKFR